MRSRPYRNERIICVIHDLYFTGGNKSFSAWFSHLFPCSYGNNRYVMEYEVPIPMVALVAMAVSTYLSTHVSMLTQVTSYMHPYMNGIQAYTSL